MDDFNFRLYGLTNIDAWQKLIRSKDLDWKKYDYRQKTFNVHKETLTIPLIWNEVDLGVIKYWEDYPAFEPLVKELQKVVENSLGINGKVNTALLIKMEPGANIPLHYDSAIFFKLNKRIHLPIFTNERCMFTVNNEVINMKEGEIWEINNNGKPHGVYNQGLSDRIHLLIDWMAVN